MPFRPWHGVTRVKWANRKLNGCSPYSVCIATTESLSLVNVVPCIHTTSAFTSYLCIRVSRRIQAFGPESFSTLQRSVKDDVAHPSLGLVVQLLRLSRLDPDVFIKFRVTLVDQVRT